MLTIFTPTYNRGELLKRVYDSLVRQTNKDFIWLIVDDGSTDDTKAVVDGFITEKKLRIEYHYQENGGKMRAHNKGVSLCDSELFTCLDSDDYFVDDAVESIYRCFSDANSINSDSGKVGGIVAHKGRSETELLGESRFPKGMQISTLRGIYQAGFSGETTLVFLTEALKKYPFPEFDGEKYVPEDVVYDRIDAEYRLIILDKILTVCEIVSAGYTDQAKRLRAENPNGWYIYYKQRMISQPFSVLKIKYISHFIIFAKALSLNPQKESDLGFIYLTLGYIGAFVLRVLGKT